MADNEFDLEIKIKSKDEAKKDIEDTEKRISNLQRRATLAEKVQAQHARDYYKALQNQQKAFNNMFKLRTTQQNNLKRMLDAQNKLEQVRLARAKKSQEDLAYFTAKSNAKTLRDKIVAEQRAQEYLTRLKQTSTRQETSRLAQAQKVASKILTSNKGFFDNVNGVNASGGFGGGFAKNKTAGGGKKGGGNNQGIIGRLSTMVGPGGIRPRLYEMGIAGIGIAIAALIADFVNWRLNIGITFNFLISNAQTAAITLNNLGLVANNTSLDIRGISSAGETLIAFGMNAKDATAQVEAISTAVSAMGGDASQVNAIANAIGQANATGGFANEAVAQSFINAKIPFYQIIARRRMAAQGNNNPTDDELNMGAFAVTRQVATNRMRLSGLLTELNPALTAPNVVNASRARANTPAGFFQGLKNFSQTTLPDIVAPGISGVPAIANAIGSLIPGRNPTSDNEPSIKGAMIPAQQKKLSETKKLYYHYLKPLTNDIIMWWQRVYINLKADWNTIYQDAYKWWSQKIIPWINDNILTIPNNIITAFLNIPADIVNIWNGVANDVVTWWDSIYANLVSYWNNIVSSVNNFLAPIGNFISSIWNSVSSSVITWWNSIYNNLVGYWNNIVIQVNNILAPIEQFIINIWNSVATSVVTWWDSIYNNLVSYWNNVVTEAGNALNPIIGTIQGIWNTVSSNVSTAWSGIYNTVASWINSIINGINGSGILGALGLGTITPMTISKVPGAANGGIVTSAGGVMVGENGPELLKLPSGASISPLSKSSNASGNSENHFHFDGANFFGNADLQSQIISALQVAQRRGRVSTV